MVLNGKGWVFGLQWDKAEDLTCPALKSKNQLWKLIDLLIHSFFYKNTFYKNMKAEICKILRIF